LKILVGITNHNSLDSYKIIFRYQSVSKSVESLSLIDSDKSL